MTLPLHLPHGLIGTLDMVSHVLKFLHPGTGQQDSTKWKAGSLEKRWDSKGMRIPEPPQHTGSSAWLCQKLALAVVRRALLLLCCTCCGFEPFSPLFTLSWCRRHARSVLLQELWLGQVAGWLHMESNTWFVRCGEQQGMFAAVVSRVPWT